MIYAVYKSPVKDSTYLYVERRDDFSRVPEALLKMFGKPQFVMLLSPEKHQRLVRIELDQLQQALTEQGYYLQLPPPQDSLLSEHRRQLGLDKQA